MPREVELKSVVDDIDGARRRLEKAGATLLLDGRLEDRRYDTPDRHLSARDEVLRLRVYSDERGARASIDWKGPAHLDAGYKVRDEITANTTDAAPMAMMLERLGYDVIAQIDRRVVQYTLGHATIRFERYPRMDTLVEVEGPPASIERAIEALGMPRDGFTADRLATFVERFERRTNQRAAISDRQLASDASSVAVDD
jgi:predicted adenylyl cyclase CyaB